jgi:hypothetical protein
MSAIPYISNRFALKRFLGLSEEEMAENERLWQEENADMAGDAMDSGQQMRDAGITGSDLSSDLGNVETEAEPEGDAGAPPAASPTGPATGQLDTQV